MKKYKIEYSLPFDLIDCREMIVEEDSKMGAEQKALSNIYNNFDITDISEISIHSITEIE